MTSPRAPFDAVRRALATPSGSRQKDAALPAPAVNIDPERRLRAGVPEFVLADRKTPDQVIAALQRLADATGRALATRCPPQTADRVISRLADNYTVTPHREARAVVVARLGAELPATGGRIGVLAAGTSDLPVALEACVVAREMGAVVHEAWDVGVAGLHRLVAPLERLIVHEDVDALVVAAGMDGALPSVVAGLVPVPVIGLPTSVGYGLGGDGLAPLLAMLQSCAPGLTVVNIDNGVGAGATAALIASRAAAHREPM